MFKGTRAIDGSAWLSAVVSAGLTPLALAALWASPVEASADSSRERSIAATPGAHTSVVGGNTASGSEWPSITPLIASSQANARDGQFCGGTLVSARWVLTAAHCLFDESGRATAADSIDVAVGAVKLSEVTAAQRIRVSQIVVNPGFASANGYANDFALLGLSKASGQPVMPLIPASDDGLVAAGRPAKVAGWGCVVAPAGNPPECPTASLPDNLQQASVTIQDQGECATTFGEAFIGDQMICAGVGSPNACIGDSGGPMTIVGSAGTPVLVGNVSFGDKACASALDRGVYGRLSAFRSWVTGTIATDPPSPAPTPTPAPARPSAKVKAKGRTVTASVTPQTGVTYAMAATKSGKTIRGKCKRNTKTRKIDCSVKLGKGKWRISVTPKLGGVAGTPFTKSVRIK